MSGEWSYQLYKFPAHDKPEWMVYSRFSEDKSFSLGSAADGKYLAVKACNMLNRLQDECDALRLELTMYKNIQIEYVDG